MSNLLNIKGSRVKIYKTLPSNTVGNDGDIILSQIQGRGVYLCSKVNGRWHVSSKMEELRKIENTSTKDLTTNKLQVLDNLAIGRGTTTITKDEAKFSSSLKIKEASNAISDTVAYGQLWVKTATPNELYFTTDAGNDIQLTSGTTAAGGGASALNDLSDVTYSSGDLTITSLDKLVVGDFLIDSSGDITLDAGGLNINFAYNGDNLVLWDLQNDLNLKMKMPLNPSDYFEIDVTSNGATTIKTVDAIGAVGHMTIDPDGDLDLRGLICDIYPDTKIELKINDGVEGLQIINEEFQKLTASFDSSEDSYSQFRLYEAPVGTIVDYFQIQTEHDGKTTISTYDAAGSDAHLHFNVDGQLKLDTPPRIKEQASADSDTAAYGQLWVKNDTPNNLYFTNDAGNDVQITNGSSLAGGGGSSTTFRYLINSGFNYNYGAGTSVFIPLSIRELERPITQTSMNELLAFVPPYDGYLNQVVIRSEEACGLTIVALHKSSTGTELPSQTASNTVTVDMTTDDTPYKFAFGASASFSAGEILAISFDPTNDANDTNFTVEFIFDSSSGL